ncbi:hypothetical protein NADFUDRAFT_83674 [Nadsonia fulvescens var. elongata DSM 6958]|uniref:Uncharacterized protein n=1 Tax=Nadsonia fulvescens var. elongata DSM 6958 TaxID=857566 RepID=A0A1E3PHB2_9ASCO|nr:hypothetical protein NADFUDRAFT_83674 [Nadsonia fulvescens var. elongata DSM 6958]
MDDVDINDSFHVVELRDYHLSGAEEDITFSSESSASSDSEAHSVLSTNSVSCLGSPLPEEGDVTFGSDSDPTIGPSLEMDVTERSETSVSLGTSLSSSLFYSGLTSMTINNQIINRNDKYHTKDNFTDNMPLSNPPSSLLCMLLASENARYSSSHKPEIVTPSPEYLGYSIHKGPYFRVLFIGEFSNEPQHNTLCNFQMPALNREKLSFTKGSIDSIIDRVTEVLKTDSSLVLKSKVSHSLESFKSEIFDSNTFMQEYIYFRPDIRRKSSKDDYYPIPKAFGDQDYMPTVAFTYYADDESEITKNKRMKYLDAISKQDIPLFTIALSGDSRASLSYAHDFSAILFSMAAPHIKQADPFNTSSDDINDYDSLYDYIYRKRVTYARFPMNFTQFTNLDDKVLLKWILEYTNEFPQYHPRPVHQFIHLSSIGYYPTLEIERSTSMVNRKVWNYLSGRLAGINIWSYVILIVSLITGLGYMSLSTPMIYHSSSSSGVNVLPDDLSNSDFNNSQSLSGIIDNPIVSSSLESELVVLLNQTTKEIDRICNSWFINKSENGTKFTPIVGNTRHSEALLGVNLEILNDSIEVSIKSSINKDLSKKIISNLKNDYLAYTKPELAFIPQKTMEVFTGQRNSNLVDKTQARANHLRRVTESIEPLMTQALPLSSIKNLRNKEQGNREFDQRQEIFSSWAQNYYETVKHSLSVTSQSIYAYVANFIPKFDEVSLNWIRELLTHPVSSLFTIDHRDLPPQDIALWDERKRITWKGPAQVAEIYCRIEKQLNKFMFNPAQSLKRLESWILELGSCSRPKFWATQYTNHMTHSFTDWIHAKNEKIKKSIGKTIMPVQRATGKLRIKAKEDIDRFQFRVSRLFLTGWTKPFTERKQKTSNYTKAQIIKAQKQAVTLWNRARKVKVKVV